MDISVIIVNFNTTDHLTKCLNSINENISGVTYEIIVVDNNSPNREIEKFPAKYPSAKFYFREKNDGFGAGCNFGAEKANGKYLLFMNPDIVLISDIFSEIFRMMQKDPEIGAVSPVYVEDNGEVGYTYNNFPGVMWQSFEAFGFGTTAGIKKLSSREELKNNIPFEVDWVMGSFIFTRSDIFNKVRGFDDKIFLYYEDVDLQYNIKKLGYKIICRPDLKIMHFKRSSVRSFFGENLYYFHMARSNLIYMYKHYDFFSRNFSRSLYIFGILARIVSLPFRIKFKNKKQQKLEQYKFILGLYFKTKSDLFSSQMTGSTDELDTASQRISYDKFWKN